MSSSDNTFSNIVLRLHPQSCVFNNEEFFEMVDMDILDVMIQSDLLGTDSDALKNKNMLIAYNKKYDSKYRAIKVKYSKSNKNNNATYGYGRCFPVYSLGLSMMNKQIRNTLISELMVDIDLVNSQSEILLNICKNNRIDCDNLEQYCVNRDEILASTQEQYGLGRYECKELFICIMYGGKFNGWKRRNKLPLCVNPSQFVSDFALEITAIAHVIQSQNEELYQKCEESNKLNNKTYNLLGSFLSIFLQEHETRIIEKVYTYLKNQTDIVDSKYFIYEFDGVKLIKEKVEAFNGGCQGLIVKLEEYVKETLRFDIHFAEKPIEAYYKNIVITPSTFVRNTEIEAMGNGYNDRGVAEYFYKHFCFASDETIFEPKNQIIVSSGIKGKMIAWYLFKKETGWKMVSDSVPINNIIASAFRDHIKLYYNAYAKSSRPDADLLAGLDKLISNCFRATTISTIVSSIYDLAKINDFENLLDVNPFLLACSNGVIDLKNKVFREKMPSDLCSLSTLIEYRTEYGEEGGQDDDINEAIDDFFAKIFPMSSERMYIWEYMASVLFGSTINQLFNYFIGWGSNGKSLHMELMSKILGEYFATVNTNLLTKEDSNSGQASPDLFDLRGKRFAVAQEPKDTDALNVARVKIMTGSDTLKARQLFCPNITFKPMYSLAICANSEIKVDSTNDGIWRRMQLVKYISKFVDSNPNEDINHYLKDRSLEFKLDGWKEHMLYRLVQIGFATQGIIQENEAITKASNDYRNSQDKIGQFIDEMIIPSEAEDARVDKKYLHETFKAWIALNYNVAISSRILYDRLKKNYDLSLTGFYTGFFIRETDINEVEIYVNPVEDFLRKINANFEITPPEDNNFYPVNQFNGFCDQIGIKLSGKAKVKALEKLHIINENRRIGDNKKQCRCYINLKKRTFNEMIQLDEPI